MKAYLLVTAFIFAAVTVAHIARIATENSALARDPWYLGLTVLAAALFGWAVSLLRRARGA